MKRKLWTLLLALVLAVCVVPMMASAAEVMASGTCGKDIYWILYSDGTLNVIGKGSMTSPPCTEYADYIRKVNISYGVTNIFQEAFLDCRNLLGINIAQSVEDIGDGAFLNCSSLQDITLPDSVVRIGEYAFYGCSALSKVIIPDSVAMIGSYAFYGCDNLAGVYITDLAAWCEIYFDNAYSNPLSIANKLYINDILGINISIPNGVTSIGQFSFYNYTALASVDIPRSVSHIGWAAFCQCTNLTNVEIPYAYTISSYAFSGCSKLTSVFIDGDIECISVETFSNCENLKNISIDNRFLYKVEYGAFRNCDKLEEIHISDLNMWCATEFDRELYGTDTSCSFADVNPLSGGKLFLGDMLITDLVIPAEVDEISKGAFYECDSIESVTISHALSKIGESAFDGCRNLKYISLGRNIPVAGKNAFSRVIAIALYYAGGTNSSTERMRNYGNTITWIPYGSESEHTHTFGNWEEIEIATCMGAGLRTRNCSCGKTEVEEIPAPGHKFSDGTCTVCEEKDPDYVKPTEPEPTEPEPTEPEPTETEEPPVDRIAGTNRISTALTTSDMLKEVMKVEKYSAIVVADAMNFPDALSGSYLAAVAKAPILLYKDGQSSVVQYIKENLSDGGTVYILGGESSVPESLVSALPGVNCERVSGSGRWATSLAIIAKADEILGTKPNKILICDGTGFADSLSASATGLPILLVNGKGTLREDQKIYLESVRGAELYAIGGVNTITPDLLKELDAYDANGAERVYGSGRELTSAAVAKTFFPEAKTAALASSLDFPDGLSGGPVAFAMKAPLLLTRENKEAAAKDYVNSKGITSGYIIGGEKAVSDTTAERIFGK